MKRIIQLEEAAQFALSVVVFAQLPFGWWVYPALLLLPDLSMIGYAVNARIGAIAYNLFHHKALAIALGLLGFFLASPYLLLTGAILFGHSAMDRMMGYGLKYTKGFAFTHLGPIGPAKQPSDSSVAV